MKDILKTSQQMNFEVNINETIFPLTPIQAWFFAQEFQDINHFNQAVAIAVFKPLLSEPLIKAIYSVIAEHSVLRTQFIYNKFGWTQHVCSLQTINIEDIYEEHILAPMPQENLYKTIEAIAMLMQSHLNIQEGLLLKIANITCDNKQYLIFVIHHLITDGLSWRIFLADLAVAYNQLLNFEQVRLSPNISYQNWIKYLLNYVKLTNFDDEYRFWLGYENISVPTLPTDFDRGLNLIENSSTQVVELNEILTECLLIDTLKLFDISIDELLAVALAFAICDWSRQTSVYISLENSGRAGHTNEVDLSRTIGWFTNIFPAILDLSLTTGLERQVFSIKNQLRNISKHGFSYGILRYLLEPEVESMRLKQIKTPQIILDYFVNLDSDYKNKNSLGEQIFISLGEQVSPKNKRLYLLEIGNWIINGKLQSGWTFSINHYHSETIQQLSNNYLHYLKKLIIYSKQKNKDKYSQHIEVKNESLSYT